MLTESVYSVKVCFPHANGECVLCEVVFSSCLWCECVATEWLIMPGEYAYTYPMPGAGHAYSCLAYQLHDTLHSVYTLHPPPPPTSLHLRNLITKFRDEVAR